MAASAKFAKVKGFFDTGVWSESRVKDAVIKGWITEAEFKQITGHAYSA